MEVAKRASTSLLVSSKSNKWQPLKLSFQDIERCVTLVSWADACIRWSGRAIGRCSSTDQGLHFICGTRLVGYRQPEPVCKRLGRATAQESGFCKMNSDVNKLQESLKISATDCYLGCMTVLPEETTFQPGLRTLLNALIFVAGSRTLVNEGEDTLFSYCSGLIAPTSLMTVCHTSTD